MNITKQKTLKKNIIIIATILVIAALTAYILWFKGSIFGWSAISSVPSTINYDEATDQQIQAGKNIKDQTTSSDSEPDPNSVGSDKPSAPIVKPGEVKGTITVKISAANQNDGVLQIRSLISAVSNSGTCTLTLSNSNQAITRTSAIQPLSSSSTCKGFDLPVSELSPGIWQARLLFENENIKGEDTRNITVL